MPIRRMVPNAFHIKEFYDGFNGTCTQTSAAMCVASALGAPTTHDGVVALMLTMTRAMIAAGKASANGAATVANMANEMRAQGADVALEWDYAGDALPHDWHSVLVANAGIRPILLQLSNAQGLSDVAGHGEDSGVHYHAIAVMGIANEGYVIGDPDNPTVESTFDIYNYAALTRASPCGLIMLNVKGATPVMSTPAGYTLDADGRTLHANGFSVSEGLADWTRSHDGLLGLPLANAEYPTNAVRQLFERGRLRYDNDAPANGVYLDTLGTDYQQQAMALANAEAKLAEPPTQVIDTTAVTLKAALTAFLA